MRRRFEFAHQGGLRRDVLRQLNRHFTPLMRSLDSYRQNLERLLVRRLRHALDDRHVPAFLAAPANPNDEFFHLGLNEINDHRAEEVRDQQHSWLMKDLRSRLVRLLNFISRDLQNVFGNGARLREEQQFHLDNANDILERIKAMADIVRPEFQAEGAGPREHAIGFD
ncbi:hypothetical protein TYRP_023600 [Tyrophagus putrescentiae]|nr:hypothetical protein TYRP_023600 [Tyrophagus putrescentiae]